MKANVSVPVLPSKLSQKLFADLEFQYTSSRAVIPPVAPGASFDTEAGAFAVLNFTLFGQNLVKGLDLSASIYNLLDRHYSHPATPGHQQALIEQDGRSFRVKLTYRF